MKNFSSVLMIAITLSGCASMSNRQKSIGMSLGVGIGAGSLGAMNAPNGENKAAHFMLWGGLAGLATSLISLFVFDEEKKSENIEKERAALESEVRALRGESVTSSQSVILSQSGLEREVPEQYRKLVKPGSWKIYKTDVWVNSGENTIIHQDKEIQLIPPQFQSVN